MPLSIGIIGLGRMAQAILTPLIEKEDFKVNEVLGVVGQEETAKRLLEQMPKGINIFHARDERSKEIWSAPIKILAVKPQQLNQIQENKDYINLNNEKPLLVSVLAGVNLKRLQLTFPNHCCVRAVPNIPVLVAAGLTGLSFGKDVSLNQKSSVEAIFNPISEVIELPEEQLDAFLALTSSGPAYVALITEALSDGAVAAGLPRSLANELATKTLAGSATLLEKRGMHPAELKDMVASPSGTTIAALRHLEMSGIRSALIEAVVLAAERSRELS